MNKISLKSLNTIMKYVVHYVGEWSRNPNSYGDPIFNPGWTKEYNNLDEMELFFQNTFNEMIQEEQLVLHSGVHVFQIQK